jgi:hypothetical protein
MTMNVSRLVFCACAVLVVMFASGCGSKQVVFAGEKEPEDFSLSFSQPFEFQVPVTEAMQADWSVELTYFPEQLQGWNEIPVYYIHGGPDGKETDGKFKIPVKDAKGEWIGTPQENGHDRLTEMTFQSGKDMAPGQHTFKIYGDNTQQGQPILGIVRFTLKVSR